MPFARRRGNSPANVEKHEMTWSLLGVNASAVQRIAMAFAVKVGDKDISTDVAIGSHIKWLYLEFNFSAETIGETKIIHWNVIWEPPGLTIGIPSIYNANTKAYVIKRGMEMLPKSVNTVIKRIFVVPIPKAYQRQKEGSNLIFQFVASSAETINACGIGIYKEIN